MVILSSPAVAAGAGGLSEIATYFTTVNTQEDIAFRLLDSVFGVPDLFNSKEEVMRPFHIALHNLFNLYSVGILTVAVFILVYFIFAVAAETAQEGTPFGRRFNQVWAPIRLVVAFGLLIPFGIGLNSAQWITLYAAKWGSSFATNGWIKFNQTAQQYVGEGENLVATPNIPDIHHLPSFMMVAHACRWIYKAKTGHDIQAWLVKNPAEGEAIPLARTGSFAAGNNMPGTDYDSALEYFNNGDIHIRFGEKDKKYSSYRGNVFPYCGHLVLQTTDVSDPSKSTGSKSIQEEYYEMIVILWNTDGAMEIDDTGGGDTVGPEYYLTQAGAKYVRKYGNISEKEANDAGLPDMMFMPSSGFKRSVADSMKQWTQDIVDRGIEKQKALGDWSIDQRLLDYGWAGSAIWYNRIAELNGTVLSAIHNVPRPELMPSVMEYTKSRKLEQDINVSPKDLYDPAKSGSAKEIKYKPGDAAIARTLNAVYRYWYDDGIAADNTKAQVTGNAFIDSINALLGTQGLFDICKNTDIHPLAQLSQVGKSLIESAVRNFGYSFFSGTFGGLAYLAEPQVGAAGFAVSGFFTSIASIGLLIGFILFYILPFMPFLYFFFAVGTWIKGLFEAMVGVPLWALAHLRIDGEGLPGDAAQNGYFFIFEIFLRPILIVFGFLASIVIFTAMVKVLNEIYYIAVSNLSGFNPDTVEVCGKSSGETTEVTKIEYFRGPVDQFFFTVMYTIIVYMIGLSCFKLIDLIPNGIMRWIGSQAKGFGDLAGETADGLLQRVAASGGLVGNSLSGAASSLSQAGEKAAEDAGERLRAAGRSQGQQQGG